MSLRRTLKERSIHLPTLRTSRSFYVLTKYKLKERKFVVNLLGCLKQLVLNSLTCCSRSINMKYMCVCMINLSFV